MNHFIQYLDNPLNVPVSFGPTKKPRRESFTNALSGAAAAFADALNGNASKSANPALEEVCSISPAMAVDLRMKNFEHLHYAKQLHDDGILLQTLNFQNKVPKGTVDLTGIIYYQTGIMVVAMS